MVCWERRGGGGGRCSNVDGAELDAVGPAWWSGHGASVWQVARGAGSADGDGGFAAVKARSRRAIHDITTVGDAWDGSGRHGGWARGFSVHGRHRV